MIKNLSFLSLISMCAANGLMNLVMLNDSIKVGAVCLDGTASGFYFKKAATSANINNWVIHFQGGGWCFNEGNCYQRTSSRLGSSSYWTQTLGGGGIMSTDCSVNPEFCNYNFINIPYCDGASFTGNADLPSNVYGKDIYFRGSRILSHVLDVISKPPYNIFEAENVLLGGGSAGGLAAFLHADRIGDWLTEHSPNLKRYKVAPSSGFFLNHDNVNGVPVFFDEFQYMMRMANSTGGTCQACVAKNPNNTALCMFAENCYSESKYPTFVLNSAMDKVQLSAILDDTLAPDFPKGNSTSGPRALPDYSDCIASAELDQCNSTQITLLNSYLNDFQTLISKIPSYSKNGNGAFIHSCHTHIESLNNLNWTNFKSSDGSISMKDATAKWWNSNLNIPSEENTYKPCDYRETTAPGPRICNPTC
eukprot:TRINITY_DN22970_c0_g1_i1.p1 TRINITY_DN22970_c0_g1~~TRINITY_DN22970_c0_g1_i1.p1  ORF type:complete len:429 (+),score=67.52 TRINITY_DN22970_c0_g1_i1:30-1289(+)